MSASSPVDRERLVAAVDELHERAWARGEDGSPTDRHLADALARALGWPGGHGTTPDGHWLRTRLAEVLR